MPDEVSVTEGASTAAAQGASGDASAAATQAPAGPRGTQQAIDEARQRLARGERLVGDAKTGGDSADGGEQADDEQQGEGDEQEQGEEQEQEQEQGEDQGQGDGEQKDGEQEESKFKVTLPGIEDRGEQPLDLEAPDQETFERLNRLNNEAAIGRQVKQERREIQRSRGELAELEDKIGIDPAGFVLEHMPDSFRPEIAMQMFFEPAVLDAIQAKLRESGVEGGIADVLDNPEALRTLRAELKASRLEMRDKLRAATEERRSMQANAERIISEIERLIPESVTGDQRDLLFRDAVRDVRERCERLGLKQIDPEDVQLLVSARFRQMGISLSTAGNGTPEQKKPAPARTAAGGRTAEQFKQARDVRRAAAATAPAGAGTPAAKARPDLPKTTDERIKLARKVGLARLLGRS